MAAGISRFCRRPSLSSASKASEVEARRTRQSGTSLTVIALTSQEVDHGQDLQSSHQSHVTLSSVWLKFRPKFWTSGPKFLPQVIWLLKRSVRISSLEPKWLARETKLFKNARKRFLWYSSIQYYSSCPKCSHFSTILVLVNKLVHKNEEFKPLKSSLKEKPFSWDIFQYTKFPTSQKSCPNSKISPN